MSNHRLSLFTVCGVVIIAATLYGCSENKPKLGQWQTKEENHEYVLLTAKDAQDLSATPPAPFPDDNQQQWVRVKKIGEPPEKIETRLQPYSIAVLEASFAFLQSTSTNNQQLPYEDLDWGWRLIVENRSKRDVYAYGGYSLFDKDGFSLTETGTDWDNNEPGVLIKPGERGVVQGKAIWRINRATKPYASSRAVRGDYKLFLRHNWFEDAFDDSAQKRR